jgi:RNA polymerase sigma factor (sigma-70 family)
MEDQALIEQYAQHGSESAFAELTQRYEGFVFSTALRQVRDADLARDVVQNVFLCFARKAGSLGREPILAGWLGRATRFEALKVLRERRRRGQREEVFVADATEFETAPHAEDCVMEEVHEALQGLGDKDRRALMLRFAEGKSLKEAALILGISEDAAQKRIARAVEKLRVVLARKGLSSASLAALLGAPAFSTGVTAATVAASTTGASVFVTLSPLLAMAKLKVVAITCAAAALTVTPFAIHYLKSDPVNPSATEAVSPPQKPGPTENRETAEARSEAAALRTEVAALRSELKVVKEAPQEVQPAVPEPDPMTALKQRVLNSKNDPRDRVKALGELRDRNGRDAQVAAAMATLARSTTDSTIRADIFRQLSGMKDPTLKPVLIEALKQDASDEVRGEAAETLAAYGDDPAVVALLTEVSRADADSDVREQAVEALVKNAPANVLQRIQNDPQATDLELYHSTSALRKQVGADKSQAALLLNVLKESKIPDLRKEIVEDLGKHYGSIPEVSEWMDHLANTEQDPKVRREAAKFSTKGLR